MITVRKDAILGFVDQGLISLSNLGISVLLIKLTGKESFGLYGIGFSIILLLVGVANAIITSQMAVWFPEKPDKTKYCFAMLVGQCILFLLIWSVFAIVCLVGLFLGLVSHETMVFAFVISIVVMMATFHEFMRRYFYIALMPYRVLQIDVVNVLVIFSSLLVAFVLHIGLTHVAAVMIYGVAALAAGAVGFLSTNLYRKVTFSEVGCFLTESWVHGKWALGGVVVTWVQFQSYVAILSILASVSSVAEANAARLFLAPVGIISTGLGQVFFPRLAILRASGEHSRLIRMSRIILVFTISVICLIVLISFLIKDYVLANYFPRGYENIGSFILLWAVVFLTQAVCTNASILLQIYKRFRVITVCNFYTSIVTVIATYLLIKLNGISGSIQAMVLGQIFLAMLLVREFNLEKNSQN
jgi:O-antigen/teichoic acid export membrane protein